MDTARPPRLSDQILENARRSLTEQLDSSERIIYCLKSDLKLQRIFGESHVVLTSDRIAVLEDCEVIRTVLLAGTECVKVEELYGGGRLAARSGGEDVTLGFCTLAMLPEFNCLARHANALIQKGSGLVLEQVAPAYCPQCGAQLPERSGDCPMCVSRRAVLLRLLSLVQPYRLQITLLMLGTILGVAANMGPPYITKMIVDDVIGGGSGSLPFWIACLFGCNVLLLLSRGLSSGMNSWLAGRLITDLRSRLHTHLQYIQLSFYSSRPTGEIVARVMNDTAELQNFLIGGLPYFLVNSISLVVIAFILFRLDTMLALLVFVPVPLLVGGGSWFWRRLFPLFYKRGSRQSALHTTLQESLRSVKIVKAFSQEGRRAGQFDRHNDGVFRVSLELERNFIGFSEVMFFVMSLGVTLVWYFASRRLSLGDPSISVGDLLAFVGYIWLFYGPLQWFTAVMNWMTHAFSGAERIFAVLDSAPEVHDAPDAVAIPRLRGAISFTNVSFGYERGKDVIRDLSLDIAAGEMVGLVGKSGAGKSTLVNLICRFYEPNSGLITIDGYPAGKLKLGQMRSQIGIVTQEPILFNCSILENIRYGRPDAGFQEVVRAARAAHAHDFIVAKEDGYDTIVGENGCALSGGERQRISIARAILHDPPVLILDEATSSVDSETERHIQEGIASLIRGRTTIAIAHRLATLRNASRLVVVDDGSIVEEGTHEELLARGGYYARLVGMQLELHRRREETMKV